MFNVAIVGHGSSLKTNRLGYLIDTHDAVVRIKNGIELSNERPESFGSKTTHVCLAAQVLSSKSDYKKDSALYPEGVERWLYDLQSDDETLAFWMKRYLTMKTGNAGFFSTGTAAVMFACKHLAPLRLSLFGFDAYRHPGAVYTNSFGKVMGPGHSWALERLLIEEMAMKSGTSLIFVE